ncbi:hypothetical protein DPMN_174916 [Dreissena polymorpha]|uniref:Uncharacterized protein n=1 Tax=Dreissena polymorpha TaxID=45954 RepID=A0A9D4IHK9_DREPO|nr:hypothetical protein DPMN_174916 [Dreissena polymorpha]
MVVSETPNRITTDITEQGEGGPPAGGSMTPGGEKKTVSTGSHQAKDHHLHQDYNHHRYMGCPNHVRDREDSTTVRRDEEVQPHHHRDP